MCRYPASGTRHLFFRLTRDRPNVATGSSQFPAALYSNFSSQALNYLCTSALFALTAPTFPLVQHSTFLLVLCLAHQASGTTFSDTKSLSRNHVRCMKSPKRLKSAIPNFEFCLRGLKTMSMHKTTIPNATISVRYYTQWRKTTRLLNLFDPALCVYVRNDTQTKTHSYRKNRTMMVIPNVQNIHRTGRR